LTPTLLAAWMLGFICLLIDFLYIRFGFGVSFGGKELACLAVLAVGTLLATLIGTLLGSAPIAKGAQAAKAGMAAFLVTGLSVFAGLYGQSSQSLGDYVSRNLPVLSLINPVRQIADAFYSLYYYDGYGRLLEILLVLGVMSAICFIGCIFSMRKQRFRSLP